MMSPNNSLSISVNFTFILHFSDATLQILLLFVMIQIIVLPPNLYKHNATTSENNHYAVFPFLSTPPFILIPFLGCPVFYNASRDRQQ